MNNEHGGQKLRKENLKRENTKINDALIEPGVNSHLMLIRFKSAARWVERD